ncbi:MAG: hypothetical protein LIP04_05025 [Tannerellaceae bacterium]|nr:hypothetical protein [Tannerellaceae bacterium]
MAFITANTAFNYLLPAVGIRMLALVRTVTRYFERLENHKTTLEAQQSLQLKIFRSVAGLPYFKKQASNNPALLESSTQGVDQLLNYVLLWLLPFTALLFSLGIYFFFLLFFFTGGCYRVFDFFCYFAVYCSSVIFPAKQKSLRGTERVPGGKQPGTHPEFPGGRIEISKYNLGGRAIGQYKQRLAHLERLEINCKPILFICSLLPGLGLVIWLPSCFGIQQTTKWMRRWRSGFSLVLWHRRSWLKCFFRESRKKVRWLII